MNIFAQIWDFFASVRLAIYTLCTLALTSIIGTIIQQGEPAAFYSNVYGPKWAKFIDILNLSHMYTSWWFLALLTVLALNLIICSLERLPTVLKIINQDNTTLSSQKIQAMKGAKQWKIGRKSFAFESATAILNKNGWKGKSIKRADGQLYFAQKQKWSRLGVYIVHLSILVIFAGAIVGSLFGFKASVYIPEGKSVSQVFSMKDNSSIDLGFAIHCNLFAIEYYPSGMPKEYMSSLSVLENNQIVRTEEIEVNSPLTHKGITFYQSSFQPFDTYFISITNTKNDERITFEAPFQKQINWEKQNLQFGILNVMMRDGHAMREKLWIKAADHPASQIEFENNTAQLVQIGDESYRINIKQLYATGLQVAKDPGVPLVYLGCLLMLLGLYMAFFMSHRRVWLLFNTNEKVLVLSASSNKNRMVLQRQLTTLQEEVEKILPLENK